jgi:hypothetical protein
MIDSIVNYIVLGLYGLTVGGALAMKEDLLYVDTNL